MKQHLLHILWRIINRIEKMERVRIVFAAFVLFAISIVWATFRYAVLDYGYYK